MSGTAKILGNSAPKGGGVFIETDRASLTKTGGTVYGNDDAANANEATDVNGGHALYKGGGTVNTNTGVTGTTDSTF
jgi:hypothetical protein